VIGLPGETLEVRDGVTLIDGAPIEEPFLVEANTVRYHKLNYGPVEIPEGYYFVMGDNRDNSNDSRTVGLISTDKMIGRARIMMWPLNRIGMVAGSDTYQ
jgi:signal peptidase I